MKRFLSVVLCMLLLSSLLTVFICADFDASAKPDLVITELTPNTTCDIDGSGKDSYEFIEIFNISGKTLNLYDYCICYNANIDTRTSPNKKTDIVPGDVSTSLVDTSLTPANPETAVILPNQIFIIWMWNFDSYKVAAALDDFRVFWNLDKDVAVYIVDADNSEATGNALRFNLANSDQKGYYIAPKDYSLDSQSDAGTMSYNFWRKAEMTDGASVPDYGSHYIYNSGENKKQMVFSNESEATPGTISQEQLASFPNGTSTEVVTEAPATTAPVETAPPTTQAPVTQEATDTVTDNAGTTGKTDSSDIDEATDTANPGGSGTGSVGGVIIVAAGAAVLLAAVVVVIIVIIKKKK